MLYTFGPYTLDTRRRELLTAEDVVSLRPKVFGLLAYLIENRERVVSKQELFERLWPGVHVGDATLNTCIKAARQAVGDNGRSQTVIQTKHGHGYRFIAPVEERSIAQSGDSGAAAAGAGDRPEDLTPPSAPPQAPAHQEKPDPEQRPAFSPDAFPSGKEHRQVTVLHCALLDAPRLAASLGAEVMDETMERLMNAADGIVKRYGGVVIQWLGDGFITLFGGATCL